MTPERRREFEAEWPQLAARIARFVQGRGIRDGRCDDIVQETALRLFGMWDRVVPGAPLWPLVRTITLNVLRDSVRRHDPEPTDPPPEPAPRSDAEAAGIARMELQRVRVALGELTPAQRAALLAEVGATSAGTRDDAAKMLRLRARRKLSRLLQRSPLIAPLRWGRLSELGQWAASLREAAVQGISCFACVALGLGSVIAGVGAAPARQPVPRADAMPADVWAAPAFPVAPPATVAASADPGAPRVPPPPSAPSEARPRSRGSAEGGSGTTAPASGKAMPLVPEDLPLPNAHAPGDGEIVSDPAGGLPDADGGGREAPLPVPPEPALEPEPLALTADAPEVVEL